MLPLLLHLSATAASSLITSTAETALIALCVYLCLRLIPAISATLRSVIWTAVFLVAAALPFLTPTHPASASTTTSTTPIALSINWAIGIATFWAALSLFRIAQLLRSAVHLSGVARRSTLTAAITKTPIATSTEIEIPCVAGFLTPRILIPAHLYTTLTPSELSQIVTHEQAHLNRFDHWTNLLQKLLIALYPIHPVLLWIERRLCIERELACDDAVLRHNQHQTGARKQYALCLTNLAENSLARRGFTLALRAWERQSELTRRVLRILQAPTRQLRPAQSAAVAGTLLAALTTGAATLRHTPLLISFSTPEPAQSFRVSSVAQLHREGWDPLSHSASSNSSAKPAMVNTSMVLPTKSRKSLTRLKTGTKHPTPIIRAALEQTPAAPRQWVMLTTFQSSTEEAPQYHQAIFQTSDATYAAVPTQSGWLIIQL